MASKINNNISTAGNRSSSLENLYLDPLCVSIVEYRQTLWQRSPYMKDGKHLFPN